MFLNTTVNFDKMVRSISRQLIFAQKYHFNWVGRDVAGFEPASVAGESKNLFWKV